MQSGSTGLSWYAIRAVGSEAVRGAVWRKFLHLAGPQLSGVVSLHVDCWFPSQSSAFPVSL
jgi:hypothetical protein